MSDKHDPVEPLELLPDAVEGYCDLETGECVTLPLPADDKSVTADPPPVAAPSRRSTDPSDRAR
ncbi:hypothetical protein ABT124_49615 [Streptomyces sp. NPDC001982]|uniref:hypothetical protein n=1 Tax=Streptomyces sp. NPDC001982 TaxID=3154405 RepID=UPI0033280904